MAGKNARFEEVVSVDFDTTDSFPFFQICLAFVFDADERRWIALSSKMN